MYENTNLSPTKLTFMRILLLITALILGKQALHAQTPKGSIRGTTTDTMGTPLFPATILLMDPEDSTLIEFKVTDEKGGFHFSRLDSGEYLVKATFIGYMPILLHVSVEGRSETLLGNITMEEISQELFEVVVRAAKAPMTIRGDTIEYDATKFKVPQGSTVEDLLRRLPGMEVSQDGTVSSEGQEIRRVTVDGRRFFGGDVKSATKNLPAEGISKVQVFTEETEEKKLTGTTSAPPEKMMNLELKEDFKKGGFGRITGGVGTKDRAELKGMFNKFSERHQLSLIGNINNTGRNGLGWDDYQDFRGSQAFNWNSGDDFGFGGSGEMFIIMSSSDFTGMQGAFFGGGQRGIPLNYSAGINYGLFLKKTEVNAVYFFNYNKNRSETIRTQRTFLPDRTLYNLENGNMLNSSFDHQVQMRIEHKFDSLHTLAVNINALHSDKNNNQNVATTQNRNNTDLINRSIFDNKLDLQNFNGNASVIFRKKYQKSGRSSAISANYLQQDIDQLLNLETQNDFYSGMEPPDSTINILQDQLTDSRRIMLKSSAMHVEPINKYFFSQTFYNFSHRLDKADRDVSDITGGEPFYNDFLSRYYDNTIQLHRLGTSVRYANKGYNLSIGAARQVFLLDGAFRTGPVTGIDTTISRTFYNWIPNLSFNGNISRNTYFNLNYSVQLREPNIQNLQPVIDNSNPLFISEGNPNLIPQTDHRINFNYRKNNPARFTNFNINLTQTFAQDAFVNEQTINDQGITFARMTNYKGGTRSSIWTSFGFPIIKTKLTANINFNGYAENRYTPVNLIENKTTSISGLGGFRVNYSPSEHYLFFLNASYGATDTRYSIHTSQNQLQTQLKCNVTATVRLLWKIYLSSSLNYDRYTNERLGFDTEVPLLDASVYRRFLPDNKVEIRLSGYDLLNRNLAVSQNTFNNVVSESSTRLITRYFMLTLTYNIKGISNKNQQNFMFF